MGVWGNFANMEIGAPSLRVAGSIQEILDPSLLKMMLKPVADLGGSPPTVQNFLNFMQFFAKFGKIICWRPPRGLAPPPSGNPGSAPGNSCCLSGELFQ